MSYGRTNTTRIHVYAYSYTARRRNIKKYIRGIGRGETAQICLATNIVRSVLPMSISYRILSLISVLSSPMPVEIVHRNLTTGPLVAGSLVARNMSPTPSMMGMMFLVVIDRKSTRLNSSHSGESRMPSSA